MTFDTTTIIIIVVAVLAVLILGFLLMRPKQATRIERREAEPYVANTDRPYMKANRDGPQGNSVADEVATATADVADQMMQMDSSAKLPGATGAPDDLRMLKGVGPKLAARLNELGILRYEQLAGLSDNEIAHLDERMGPFKGRLERDRIVEQARYLARGDTDGFEAKFGKLGG